MKEKDVLRLLQALLESEGAGWTLESGYLRFRSRHEGMLWETDCRAAEGAALIYARFPFRTERPEKARLLCEDCNRRLHRGALFLEEDGRPVYRCRAELDDVYGAEERLAAALEYSAQVVTRYWGRLAAL